MSVNLPSHQKNNMKRILTLAVSFGFAIQTNAQTPAEAEALEKKVRTDNTTLPQGWTKGGTVNLAFNQTHTSNWISASERYQMGIAGLVTAFGNKKKGTTLWLNNAMLQMGVLRSPSTFNQFRKNSDQLTLSSMYAPQIKPKWYYGANLDLRTQLGSTLDYNTVTKTEVKDGKTIPTQWRKTGGFMTPGNIRAGLGVMYTPNKQFRIYFSPLTASITTKLAKYARPLNIYGVDAGKSIDFGFGALVRADYQNKFKNGMTYTSRLDLFTNYLDQPFTHTNVDWINGVGFTIGKSITAAVNLNFRYYHDEIQDLQFMQMLGLGFNYKL
jgi:Protein of unknown function (DUF3078)